MRSKVLFFLGLVLTCLCCTNLILLVFAKKFMCSGAVHLSVLNLVRGATVQRGIYSLKTERGRDICL
jgi:hypothetical protein